MCEAALPSARPGCGARTPMEIHIIGPLPPPYGGVSVHISRLRRQLRALGQRCIVWRNRDERPQDDVRAIPSLLQGVRRLRTIDQRAILHFHDSHLLAGLLASRPRRVLFTVHNERINHILKGGKFPKAWLSRLVRRHYFRKVPRLIAVSERARDELVRFGFSPHVVTVLNAYLRPGDDEQSDPANVHAFESFRRRFSLVATANAWALNFFQGQDLYGMDLCLDMLARLRARQRDLGLVLAVPLGRGTPYLAALQAQAERVGVSERVLWLLEPGAYHPILRQCDLFLRPTNTDGFSISIAEAFEFGVPVVASDAIPRPPGCLTFRNRDLGDFVARVEQVIAERAEWTARSRASREPDHFQELLAIYEALWQT